MNIPKFHCTLCGDCCSRLNEDNTEFNPHFDDSGLLCISRPTLPLRDWELPVFSEHNNLIIPCKLLFDLESRQAIIVEYALSVNSCPMLINNECSTHKDKPLTCNSFPCSIHMQDKPKKNLDITFMSAKCPAELSQDKLIQLLHLDQDQVQTDEILAFMYARYGDALVYALAKDHIDREILGFLRFLAEKKIIRPAKQGYEIPLLLKRIAQSKSITVSELYRLKTGNDLQKVLGKIFLQLEANLKNIPSP